MNLTKREHFTLELAKAALSNTAAISMASEHLARNSVSDADAIIAELDRTAPKCPKCEDGGTGPLCAKHVSYGSTTGDSSVVEYHFPDVKEMVPDEDGWIPHNPGDPMPCDAGDKVHVLMAEGEIEIHRAEHVQWCRAEDSNGGLLPEYEVIAWRPAK